MKEACLGPCSGAFPRAYITVSLLQRRDGKTVRKSEQVDCGRKSSMRVSGYYHSTRAENLRKEQRHVGGCVASFNLVRFQVLMAANMKMTVF
jgi:hypothetical protein